MTRRILVLPALAAGFGLLLTGCGGSSPAPKSSLSSTPSSSSPSSSGGGGNSSAAAAIKANWVAFFASSTPVSKRVSLLQNGSAFEPVISAQSKSSLASSAAAKVNSVSNITATQADVNYTITVGGQSALPNQSGVAVYQNGVWKVGDKSFCSLLALELGKSGLPSACSSAG
jgi:hypothetical protein